MTLDEEKKLHEIILELEAMRTIFNLCALFDCRSTKRILDWVWLAKCENEKETIKVA